MNDHIPFSADDLSKSEKLLELIEKLTHVASWRRDVSTNTSIWSKQFFELIGETPESIHPDLAAYLQKIHPDDRVRVEEVVKHAEIDKKPFQYDARLERSVDDEIIIHVDGFVEVDPSGNSATTYGIAQDVTQQRKREKDLLESEERFRQLAENISEVFWMTDPAKNSMLYISPAYEKIWGRTVKSLFDHPRDWIDAIDDQDRAWVLQAAMEKQSKGTYDEQYRIKRPDGSVRWIHDRAFPIKNEKGEVYRIVGIAEDITEQKTIEETLKARTAELEGMNKSFVGRELKMVELKEELEALRGQKSSTG